MTFLGYEITAGKKAGTTLIYTSDHHLFNLKSKVKTSHALYVCHINYCSAKIKIEDNQCSYITSTHIHGTQEGTYEEYKLNDKIKTRCNKEMKRPREIYDEECAKSSVPLQYAKRKRTYQIHQRKGIPKNPKTIDDVKSYFEQEEIKERFGKSLHDKPTMFYKETVITALFAYTIFCSEIILQNLPTIRQLFIDGTFKVVPSGPFKQLLIIGIELDSHVSIPCV